MLRKLAGKTMRHFGFRRVERRPDPDEVWPNRAPGPVRFPTILIFTPPNSGSTAIAKLLQTSSRISTYEIKHSEANRLVPGTLNNNLWWPQSLIVPDSIAGTLNKVAEQQLRENPDIAWFVEKSPPNLVRPETMFALFPERRALVNNRDPYANIGSQIKRYRKLIYANVTRQEALAHLAEFWLYRSRFLRDIVENHGVPMLNYEAFCADPSRLVSALGLADMGIDVTGDLSVKDYEPQPIVNMNAEQVALLSQDEIDMITGILSRDEPLVTYFGYDLR
ncbi:hypothetical protein AN189_01185 [Loktanella sp. 3ANDIMAR09]|uniref:sulfotransferase family protein n=1 Tax=Loktanella sp. 3ANDIMAR09 TaxID=1225657 RepID=UPI0006FDEF7B|nr:sulfotransferase family protein [Loktanella sp. 3ANDIMAR09]KQI70043.1 hypothetical protein AN189_01185 [Loktanella sp. 3ANDIMAR09]